MNSFQKSQPLIVALEESEDYSYRLDSVSNVTLEESEDYDRWLDSMPQPSADLLRKTDLYKQMDALLHGTPAAVPDTPEVVPSNSKLPKESSTSSVAQVKEVDEELLAITERDLEIIKSVAKTAKELAKQPSKFKEIMDMAIQRENWTANVSQLNQEGVWAQWYPGALCAIDGYYVFMAIQGLRSNDDDNRREFFTVYYKSENDFDSIMKGTADWTILTNTGGVSVEKFSDQHALNKRISKHVLKLAKSTKDQLKKNIQS